jgi:hypothetical protein
MQQRMLTKHEREVVTVVEQTLNAMVVTKLTLAEIMEAAAARAQRSQQNA